MIELSLALIAAPVVLALYTYAAYPALLALVAGRSRGRDRSGAPPRAEDSSGFDWPSISISVPIYNEAHQIRDLLESLLALDYPRDRVQLLIVSDGSDDGSDQVVEEYRDRGVELLRMPVRGGKTAAENASASHLTGQIIVNTDASVRIDRGALKPLIAAFRDPAIGVASGRDVSVARLEHDPNVGEAGYVGYEMMIRGLETRAGSIVGASGCLYAIRPTLQRIPVPGWLSRDFAAALLARRHGLRAVSVDEALCYVPRATSLRREYRRKRRTIARGMETLWYLRLMLDPRRYGRFAWMLFSHKVCRWLLPWMLALGAAGLALAALDAAWARIALALALIGVLLGSLGWWLDRRQGMSRILGLPAFLLIGNAAAMSAAYAAFRGERAATWQPTRRDPLARKGTDTN